MLERARQFSDILFERAGQSDHAATIGQEVWTAFAATELAIAVFPERLGGVGLVDAERHGELFAVLRLLGAGDLSMARLFEGHVNAVSLVCRYGSPGQISGLAESVAAGALSAVWGADDSTGLKLVQDASGARLEGRKILASGAGFITRPLVTAGGPEGQLLCLLSLPRSHPVDLTGWQAQGMRSTATGSVDFSGIALASDTLVGAPGDFMRQPYFSGGAWRFCAAQLGAMERLVDLFRDHLVARKRGQDPYQLERLAQCATAARTARFWIEEAARRLALEEHDPSGVVAFANLTRMVTERAALDVMETVQRGVGLGAFIRPHPIERIGRDLATYLRQPVPDLAMRDGASALLDSRIPIGDF